jgi:hypothetical protein
MAATLLQLVQRATQELGLTVPNYVAGNPDLAVVQYLGLANQIGQQMVSDFEWNKIDRVHTFEMETENQTGNVTDGAVTITGLSDTSGLDTNWQVTGDNIVQDTYIVSVDSASQVTINNAATGNSTGATYTFTRTIYDLPTDWDRQINRTHWDRTNHWEMLGPKSAQEWQYLKGGIVSTGPRVRYRILGGKFQIWPLTVNSATLAYEYISNNWVYATDDTEPSKSAFSVDTDTCIFRDRLMIAGIKLKLFEVKKFDTTAFERDYQTELQKAMAQDKGAPTLSLSPVYGTTLIGPYNVQDGFFPGGA